MNEPLTAGDQALAAGFVLAALALGTALDPTSHNLWPFEILQASVVSLVLIGDVGAASLQPVAGRAREIDAQA